ncbi:aldo/keto reductase [Epithele typhae]|uniref:aldo/keto reductase n=1 Tax=Epithele typhae TaxID=378194 RepID=UPI002007702B|nr:aldo/keto reductase [Epithele typhae]KAH9916596.1 aldo/keto reductase [Epithele typhae]
MSLENTIKVGVGHSAATVGRIGHGLMMMTWRDPNFPIADEDAFAAIKAGIDALPPGAKMMLNSGDSYSNDGGPANIRLLSRFFAKYPSYADRTFLSVKGGAKPYTHIPDLSSENLRRSATTVNAELGGVKKMDLFQFGRVPRAESGISLEDALGTLAQLRDEGHFAHIGMSECNAATLRRAHAITPISVVEIEVSLWSWEEETRKVIAAARELGIAVAAYSPLGRGYLTGTLKSPKDLNPGDVRHLLDRFREDEMQHNFRLVESVKGIAEKKGATPAQLALAWVLSRGDHIVPIPGSSSKTRNLENLAAATIDLTAEDLAEIDRVLAEIPIKGGQYNDAWNTSLWG